MKVDGTGSGSVIQGAQLGMGQQTDAVSRDLQRKIEDAQKKLQEISSDKEMSEEEKMKKRQEMQKQISELQNQLRQHQIQQKREAAGKTEKKNSGGNSMKKSEGKSSTGKKGKQAAGLSQAGMTSLLSADAALDRAQIQESAAAKMNGKANVLKIEIQQDQATHGDTTRKQEELAAVEQRASNAVSDQMESLKEAGNTLQEAAAEPEDKTGEAAKAETKNEKEKDGRKDGNGAGRDGMAAEEKVSEPEREFPSIDIRL